jgi:2-polyprenyl-6-methoxyphenol hydroxylase-like FAD-dependent oxidoreductase
MQSAASMDENETITTDVLIVGAGPWALRFDRVAGRGVRCMLIEQHDRAGPAACQDHKRALDDADATLGSGERSGRPRHRRAFSRTVISRNVIDNLQVFDNAFYGARVRDERFNEPAEWIPQYVVEAVLRDHLRALPHADVRFSARFEGATQNAHGVAAEFTALETCKRTSVRAKYLVGADGSASSVRRVIGVAWKANAYARNVNIVLHAPPGAISPQAKALMYWLVNTGTGIIAPLERDKWTFGSKFKR